MTTNSDAPTHAVQNPPKPAHHAGTILVIEDDPSLALGLTDSLEFEGYTTVHTPTGSEGIHHAINTPPDCIILDLMLPDVNGFQVCTEVRKTNPTVPIIMLTARSQESDKIRGLEVGADDYVTKPFSVGELVARIRAILRRQQAARSEASPCWVIGENRVNPDTQTVERNGLQHSLTFYELETLRVLYENAGTPIERTELLERVWGLELKHGNRTVDNVVMKLRRKLEQEPEQPTHLLTTYGIGYKLSLGEQAPGPTLAAAPERTPQ